MNKWMKKWMRGIDEWMKKVDESRTDLLMLDAEVALTQKSNCTNHTR